jgi:ankyrin repeat protein
LVLLASLFVLQGCNNDPPPKEKLALFKAVEAGQVEELKKALDAGVSPNLYHPEEGYLILAATVPADVGPLRLLISAGANVNAKRKRGAVPLIATFLSGHCEQSRLLLAAGADPEEQFANAWEAAAGPEYQDKSARELYYLYKTKYPTLWAKQKACWLEVERMLK